MVIGNEGHLCVALDFKTFFYIDNMSVERSKLLDIRKIQCIFPYFRSQKKRNC